MRFMLLLPASADALEQGPPTKELVTAMRQYDEDMTKAGVLLAAEGLHPPSKGKRLRMSGGKPVITDGPFAEAKEVIAGFWIIQAKSQEEAMEWAKCCPLPEGGLMEIRQVFEDCDFPPELQAKTSGA
jgi:hypothetical protein